MDVFFAIYNAGGINRNLIPKIISVKTKSRFMDEQGNLHFFPYSYIYIF